MSTSKTKKLALKYFYEKNFSKARGLFSLAFFENPKDDESIAYAKMADFALDYTNHDISINQFLLSKENKVSNIHDKIDEFDSNFSTKAIGEINAINGILLEDLVQIIETKSDYEDMIKNTIFLQNIIIRHENELYSFLSYLIKNNLKTLSTYFFMIAFELFPNSQKLHSLIIEKKNEN